MIELIKEAQELILDRPDEAEIVHWALSLDDECRAAFMLAWNLLKSKENEIESITDDKD